MDGGRPKHQLCAFWGARTRENTIIIYRVRSIPGAARTKKAGSEVCLRGCDVGPLCLYLLPWPLPMNGPASKETKTSAKTSMTRDATTAAAGVGAGGATSSAAASTRFGNALRSTCGYLHAQDRGRRRLVCESSMHAALRRAEAQWEKWARTAQAIQENRHHGARPP